MVSVRCTGAALNGSAGLLQTPYFLVFLFINFKGCNDYLKMKICFVTVITIKVTIHSISRLIMGMIWLLNSVYSLTCNGYG